MAVDTVLFKHTKKIEGIGQGYFFWYPKGSADLKTIHDENDVLTDDELAIARNFFKKSRHARLYIQIEFPRGFKLLNHI